MAVRPVVGYKNKSVLSTSGSPEALKKMVVWVKTNPVSQTKSSICIRVVTHVQNSTSVAF